MLIGLFFLVVYANADEFKTRGYSTHAIGKWGVDFPPHHPDIPLQNPPILARMNGFGPANGLGPTERGFDTFTGLYHSGHNHYTKEVMNTNYVDWHRHNQTHKLDWPAIDNEPTVYSTHIFTREALSVVKKFSPTTPGFLYLAYTAPHDPLQVPDEYIAANTPCGHIANWRRRNYCGMVRTVDEGVGLIVEQLRKQGMLENTVIVFTSDNGGAPAVGGYNIPFRGQKVSLYEGGVHNPAFIYAPGRVRKGVYSNLAHISDLAPTILGIVDSAVGRSSSHKLLDSNGMGSPPIDGADHTAALSTSTSSDKSDSSPAPAPPPPRSEVVFYNVVFDHSSLVKGDYKLLLGFPGRKDRFEIPTTRWYDNDHRFRYIFEEVLCDAIDLYIGGPNAFLYPWILRAMIDGVYQFLYVRDPDALLMAARIAKCKFGDTMKITEENLPRADWASFEKGFTDRVQLYQINKDVGETNNLAGTREGHAIVDKMTAELRELVRNAVVPPETGHHVTMQVTILGMSPAVARWAFLAFVFCVVTLFISIFLLRKCLCGKGSKTKKE